MELIDFDSASLDKSGKTLTIVGTTPTSNWKIELEPLVYVQQPDYWEIRVMGEQQAPFLNVLTPYTKTKDVTHTFGKKGIVVVGKNKRQQLP